MSVKALITADVFIVSVAVMMILFLEVLFCCRTGRKMINAFARGFVFLHLRARRVFPGAFGHQPNWTLQKRGDLLICSFHFPSRCEVVCLQVDTKARHWGSMRRAWEFPLIQ